MTPPTIPPDDTARLATLHALRLLDSPPEETLDRITRLAARLFGVPIALISLIDRDRQWFQSRYGLETMETPRDISFCGHAILGDAPFIVHDAWEDPRFADNPLVTGSPGIRFYAGIPLASVEGHQLGTLCLIDHTPRALSDSDQASLIDLAHTAEELLRNRELEINASQLFDSLRSSEARFRSTFEQAAVGIAHISPGGTWLRVNRRLCTMLGYSEDELLTLTFQNITCPDDLQPSLERVGQLLSGEVSHYRHEKRYIRKQGDIIWASVTVSRHLGLDGDTEYIIAVIEDISARKAAELALLEAHTSLQAEVEAQTLELRQVNADLGAQIQRATASEAARHRSEQFLRTIADNLPAMIAYWDKNERCRFANNAYEEWFGYTPEQLLGMHVSDLLGPELYRLNEPHIRAVLAGETQQFERTLRKASGRIGHAQVSYIPNRVEGMVQGFFVQVAEITQLKQAEQALEQANARLRVESITDQLTGLYNRRYFNERNLEAFIRFKRLDERYALLLIDIDFFKRINDHFGHDAGDQALHTLGETLTRHLRANLEVAARIGGEEFAVLCHGDITAQSATKLAERLRQSIAAITIGGTHGGIRLTASIGVALCNEHDNDCESIYRRADSALYAAKHGGRNQVALA